jgi:hypothetical protein
MADAANTGVPSVTLPGSTAGPDSMWANQDEGLCDYLESRKWTLPAVSAFLTFALFVRLGVTGSLWENTEPILPLDHNINLGSC